MPKLGAYIEIADGDVFRSDLMERKYGDVIVALAREFEIVAGFGRTRFYSAALALLIGGGAKRALRDCFHANTRPSAPDFDGARLSGTIGLYHSLGRMQKSFDVEVQFVADLRSILAGGAPSNPDTVDRKIVNLQRALEFSNFVVSGSESCRLELIQYFGVDPARCVTHSVSSALGEQLARASELHDFPVGKFILFPVNLPSNIAQRKRAGELMRNLRDAGLDQKMIVAFAHGDSIPSDDERLREADLVVSVPPAHLMKMAQAADLIIVPSASPLEAELNYVLQVFGRRLMLPLQDGAEPLSNCLVEKIEYFLPDLSDQDLSRLAIQLIADLGDGEEERPVPKPEALGALDAEMAAFGEGFATTLKGSSPWAKLRKGCLL